MAAIVRVKRRIDEEPQNAFVLNCKKRKTDESSNNPEQSSLLSNGCESSTILKFAGTVASQDDCITSHISKLTKDEARSIVTKNRVPTNTTSRCREETKKNAQENRFKIVNCYRASDDNNGEEAKGITVVDVETQEASPQTSTTLSSTETSSTQNQNDAQESSNNFVYDLYLPDTNDLTEMDTNLVNDLLSIQPFNDDLYNGRYNGESSSEQDSEDSNDENYWKNDYPDADTDNDSMGDEDIRRAVYGCNIDGDSLSTDDDHLSSNDDDDCRYGKAYSRYKKRIMKTYLSSEDDSMDDGVSDEDSN